MAASRSGLRAAWRRVRDVPVAGALVRAADRLLWRRTIRRSGLVDGEYYAAQRGWRRASDARAIVDYVTRGFRSGLSLNPLFDELVAGRALPEPDRVPALYAYLVSDRRTVSVHPWWDAPADGHRAGGVAPLDDVWARRESAIVEVRIGERSRSVPVMQLRAWAMEAAQEWRRGTRAPAGDADRADLVVRILQRRDRDYPRRVLEVTPLAHTDDVVVVAVGCEAGQWIGLDVAARLFPSLRRVIVPRAASYRDAVRSADAAPRRGSGTITIVGPRSDLTTAEIRALREGVVPGRAVAPVEIAPDGTVAAFGAAGTGGTVPYAILSGHPREDLDLLGTSRIEVPLLAGPTFAMAREDWSAIGGFDGVSAGAAVPALSAALRARVPGFVCQIDAGIRSTSYARHTAFRTEEPAAASFSDERRRAEEILRAAGFEVTTWRPALTPSAAPLPELEWRRPEPAALRWAIKICAPPGPLGAVWGDTHFADGLAKALRRRGHFVAVDSFDARDRWTSALDDVTLVVRGPYRISPPTTGTRVEWIISHPDQITRAEVDDFDIVYAASDLWSAAASERWNITVSPLLECTDADQFYPRGLARTDEIVFVGTARGIARPSVVVPLAAGIPVRVYGPDWRTYIPASAIAAENLPNERLSERYETASIVLNDQWPAMRQEGFIAMRPFDVVAAGGRVISEDVDGIDRVFGDAVPVFRTDEELLELLARDPADLFPDAEGLAAASERIRRDHSFDARAGRIVDDVLRHRAAGAAPREQ